MAMYQSFTGNSRRPRQVNLSGRPSNPFAAASLPSAPGPQSAIASAQADRASRAQQRERQQASSRIQRVWRGHSARRKTFRSWRQVWDEIEERSSSTSQSHGRQGAYSTSEESLRQLNRLLLFYNAKEDVRRLTWYGMRQMATNDAVKCEGGPWPRAYLELERACLSALRERKTGDEELDRVTLTMLAFAVRRTKLSQRDALVYYQTLTGLHEISEDHLHNALLAPLQGSSEAYFGLATLLARPLDLPMLGLLRSSIDHTALLAALIAARDRTMGGTPRSRLWMLGNTIFLGGQARSDAWTDVIAHLLGSLADDVELEGHAVDLDNVSFDKEVLSKITSGLPLNGYLNNQISSLTEQESVRNLLARDGDSGGDNTNNAQLLAEYALTLLRCFPRRADDIRMWLYLGPTRTTDVAATQYFWNSAKASSVFVTVWQNSRNVVELIKSSNLHSKLRDDWTVILVFLELYTFLLKIMDDEEFMGSGRRNTAILLSDVVDLVTFLKNLGFTLYFNASDLNANSLSGDKASLSLSSHFGGVSTSTVSKDAPESKPVTVAGLPGLTIDYLKGVVTGLLRAIYERDSRRRFLPADHWLMTSRFDMTSFIPGVVAEEESRHMVQDQDDEDRDDENDEEDSLNLLFRNRGHATALRTQESRARAQRKASRKRFLQSVAPRLEILQNMPFFIPFTTRVEIFRQFVHMDQEKRRNGQVDPELWRQSLMFTLPASGIPPQEILLRLRATIRRKNEFSDAFNQFYKLGSDLKEPIQITFVDEFDMPEAGIDGGGVTKEFLTSVITQAFDPEKREEGQLEEFFVENDKHLLYPNPTILEAIKLRWADKGYPPGHNNVRASSRLLLQEYDFLGRIIGKCLYEGILVDVSFAGFFLKKWALTGGTGSAPMESGYRPNINDLRELDEELYRGLLTLKNCAPEDVESLGLTFTVDDMIIHGGKQNIIERELISNGANIPVTRENRLLYINDMARYRLQSQSHYQTNAFLKGISAIIQPSWLSMFNQTELQTLIGGAAAEINVADLRRNTIYGGTYQKGDDGQEHPSIQLFWAVMSKLPDSDRRAVLKFVTSTPRGPLLGFGSLNPKFSIRDSGSDENRYPTTSTCVNLLKLPMYRSEEVLREKLLAAVNSGAGFDLS